MKIVAAWLREGGDSPDQDFETEIVVFIPGTDDEAIRCGFAPFRFTAPVHRSFVPEMTLPPNLDMRPGLLRFVNRLRRVGTAEWAWSQEYAILVQEEATPEPASPVPPASAPGSPGEVPNA
jgi:hypothetical protein